MQPGSPRYLHLFQDPFGWAVPGRVEWEVQRESRSIGDASGSKVPVAITLLR